MRLDTFPAKPELLQCYTRDRNMSFYGPAVKVNGKLGFVLHKWDKIIAVVLTPDKQTYEAAKEIVDQFCGLSSHIETCSQIKGLNLEFYKYSINQWRQVERKKTKFNYIGEKPEKLADSIVQRYLNV